MGSTLHEEVECAQVYHLIPASNAANLSMGYILEDEDECRLYFEDLAYKLIYDLPKLPAEGEIAVIYIAKQKIKQAIIERDYDLLTASEVKTIVKRLRQR